MYDEEMNNTPIDYSDMPAMTEEEAETIQFYYKDFLDKLPPEMVKKHGSTAFSGSEDS